MSNDDVTLNRVRVLEAELIGYANKVKENQPHEAAQQQPARYEIDRQLLAGFQPSNSKGHVSTRIQCGACC